MVSQHESQSDYFFKTSVQTRTHTQKNQFCLEMTNIPVPLQGLYMNIYHLLFIYFAILINKRVNTFED